MSISFEELDYCSTELGELMLRRRRTPSLPDVDIYEVKLGEYFLMTSLFHEAESQLARLGLAAIPDERTDLLVVVGGLGLGYTAAEALLDKRIHELVIVEYLEPVIDWHRRELVPNGKALNDDPRCLYHHADFFACAKNPETGFIPERAGAKLDAILLDIDHTPEHLLDPSNTNFYSEAGLSIAREQLKDGGVFALWADGKPDPLFLERLSRVFTEASGHTISFENPLTGGVSTGAVYVTRK